MGNSSLDYKKKLKQVIEEANIHLLRLELACDKLKGRYGFPLDEAAFASIVSNENDLSFADQMIYRFSKAQDAVGAKLFKAFLLYQGEDTQKPFLDILNSLEKSRVLLVADWIELRDLRNDISHNYDSDPKIAINILNDIYEHKNELKKIVGSVESISTKN